MCSALLGRCQGAVVESTVDTYCQTPNKLEQWSTSMSDTMERGDSKSEELFFRKTGQILHQGFDLCQAHQDLKEERPNEENRCTSNN